MHSTEISEQDVFLHRIKFSLFLILQIPSVILSLFIFVFCIKNHTVLRKLHTKALLVLFIVNFIQLIFNLPMPIHFFNLNRVVPATSSYCKWWIYLESTLDAAGEFLVATISVQRHILVFQPNILRIRFKRYVLYYLPLLLSILYPIIFYMAVAVYYPCDDTQWDFTSNKCGDTTCYLSQNKVLITFDWMVNTGLAIIIIILSNAMIVIRVVKQKHRRQQALPWSKQRRMTLQLLSISSLYLVTWLPSIGIGLIQQLASSDFLYQITDDYISDLSYFICIFLPWICIGLIPDFKNWLLQQVQRLKRSHNMVRPVP